MTDRPIRPLATKPALLLEPSLFYDPPYERPLEDEFAWHLVKYVRPIAGLRYQHGVELGSLRCWVDFVVEIGPHRIGFEIGDLEAGEDAQAQLYRDALLVGTGAVDVLFRLRAVDVLHRLPDVLVLVAGVQPDLFSERGHVNLRTLATPEARAFRPLPGATPLRLAYPEPPVDDPTDEAPLPWPVPAADLVVRVLRRDQPTAWLRAYDHAVAHFGLTPDQLGGGLAQSA